MMKLITIREKGREEVIKTMSVRAYHVIEIKTDRDSFNLWNDKKVVDWLLRETSFFQSLNEEWHGLTDVSIEDLERMLSEIGKEIDGDVREAIKKDIKFAEEQGDEYVQYYCY
jgi:hypothetical protein